MLSNVNLEAVSATAGLKSSFPAGTTTRYWTLKAAVLEEPELEPRKADACKRRAFSLAMSITTQLTGTTRASAMA
jgi:hypothetical protein